MGRQLSVPPSREGSVLSFFILHRTCLIVAVHFRSLSAGWLLDELDFKLYQQWALAVGRLQAMWLWVIVTPSSGKAVRRTSCCIAIIKGLSTSHAHLRASIKMCWLGAQCNIVTTIVITINLIIYTAKGKKHHSTFSVNFSDEVFSFPHWSCHCGMCFSCMVCLEDNFLWQWFTFTVFTGEQWHQTRAGPRPRQSK